MEINKFFYALNDIDLSLLDYSNAIFDIKKFGFLPLKNHLQKTITIYDTNHEQLLQILKFHWQSEVHVILVEKNNLLKLINKIQMLLIEKNFYDNNFESLIAVYTDAMLLEGINFDASDLHLESNESICRIRIRIHGVLKDYKHLPVNVAKQLFARIKIMANMSTTEHIFPQDGHINTKLHDDVFIDARVATIPTLNGEKMVIRFHTRNRPFVLEELLQNPEKLAIIKNTLRQPHGVILITGPTGSGKTSTLHSFLQFLENESINIITVENPVERIMPNITQINIRPESGFDFDDALKAILRLDPDIIMVGEIRDSKTAKIAYNAVETGHLILASMHSNDSNDAIARLQTLNIDIKNIFADTKIIIAQRLLRKLCECCKIPDPNRCDIFIAVGCNNCCGGYSNQIPIFEILILPDFKCSTLLAEAELLLRLGVTSQQEIFRVLGENCNN